MFFEFEVFDFGGDLLVDFVEVGLIESDMIESDVLKELIEIWLVEEGEFLFLIKILLLDGVEKGFTVFEGIAIVEEDDFEEGVVGMGGFDLLLRIGFEFIMAEIFLVGGSVGG